MTLDGLSRKSEKALVEKRRPRVLPGLAGLVAVVSASAAVVYLTREPATPDPATAEGAESMEAHCAVCHLNPGPEALPRVAWGPFFDDKTVVMRRHAAAIGLNEEALPTPAQFSAIRSYVMARAPSQDLLAPPPRGGLEPLEWFEPVAFRAADDGATMAGYIGVWADTAARAVVLSDVARGRLEVTDFDGRTIGYTPVGITPARIEAGLGGLLVPLMDDPEGGQLVRAHMDFARPEQSRVEPVLGDLERPIRAYPAVLEGRQGVLVEEFGLDNGGLRFWRVSPSGSLEAPKTIVDASGVVGSGMADFDGDGTDDLVALVSQEAERLVIYPGAGQTRSAPILIFQGHPGYGFVGLTLADVDQDGRVDILTVNGDNYDLESGPLKPYHGIRIFFGEGGFEFSEPLFLPLHGAVKVLARDFDLDGDLDLLALSAFPDHRLRPYESAVVYEQTEPRRFLPRVIGPASGSRWIDAATVDLDGDGALDLVLVGAYSTLTDADRRWSDLAGPEPKTMLFLRNQRRP